MVADLLDNIGKSGFINFEGLFTMGADYFVHGGEFSCWAVWGMSKGNNLVLLLLGVLVKENCKGIRHIPNALLYRAY
jgi:hypothetical protein